MKLRVAALISLMFAMACAHAPAPEKGDGVLRIYLARHGQTDWNAIRRLQGQSDRELNDAGREQAQLLRARMEGVTLDQIYSSALRRSRDTATVVAGTAAVESLAGLNEQHLGAFEGLNLGGSEPDKAAEFSRRSKIEDDTLDGGESIAQMRARVCTTVSEIRSRHRQGTILIVAHGGTNQMILRCLLDLSLEQAASIQQSNDELYTVELKEGVEPKVWKLIPESKLGDL